MNKGETEEILEELAKAGLVDKRTVIGLDGFPITQWRITDLGRMITGDKDLMIALAKAQKDGGVPQGRTFQ